MGGAEPSAALAIFMQNIFAKRIRNNARLLRRADSNRSVGAPDPASIPDELSPASADPTALERPTVDAFPPLPFPFPLPVAVAVEVEESPGEPAVLAPPPALVEPPTAVEPPTPEPSFTDEPVEAPVELPFSTTNRRLLPAIAGAIVVVLALGWLIFGRGSGPAPETTVATNEPPRAVHSAATPPAPQPTPAPSPSATPGLAASAGPSPANAVETTLRIETVPPAASIVVDGASVGVSPMDVKLPRSDKPVVVELRHASYEPVRESIVPDVDQKMRLSLEPTRAPTGPRPKATATASTNPYRRFD
jgi:hypothetical protein